MTTTYKAPLADIRFALHDVLGADALFARLGYADASRDVIDAVLDEAAQSRRAVLAPLNRSATSTDAATTRPVATSPRRLASGRPTTSSSRAGGPACPHRPTSADRVCRTRCAFRSTK